MAKDKKGEGRFKTWWKGLKSEFSKIIWLNRKTVAKQTVIVIVVTVIVGILITVIDFFCLFGLEKVASKAMQPTSAVEQQSTVASQQNQQQDDAQQITVVSDDKK